MVYTGNIILIIKDIPIREPDIVKTISGFILKPFVSSSKNLNSPALEAGIGADFFILRELICNQHAY